MQKSEFKRLTILLPEEEVKVLKKLAIDKGISASNYIRHLILQQDPNIQ